MQPAGLSTDTAWLAENLKCDEARSWSTSGSARKLRFSCRPSYPNDTALLACSASYPGRANEGLQCWDEAAYYQLAT